MLKEKIQVSFTVQMAALKFMDAGERLKLEGDNIETEAEEAISEPFLQVKKAIFEISPNELASIVQRKDISALKIYGGVLGIAKCLEVYPEKGVREFHRPSVTDRKHHFGSNLLDVKRNKSWTFLWKSLQDTTLIILLSYSVVSLCLGIAVQDWPKGIYEGLGILFLITMVVVITGVNDYKQYLLFLDLTKVKKTNSVQVTRDGKRKIIPTSGLVVGDVVHLYIEKRVPADGIFIKGNSLLVDESSLTGENKPVNVCAENPFLLSGSMVQDGSGTMLVTSVGKKTEWGKLMVVLRKNGEDEASLKVKLNSVVTCAGRIGLTLSLVSFIALLLRFIFEKALPHSIIKLLPRDLLELLKCAALSVTTFLCSVPEGLPLAVILSLAFAMRRLLNERALVRHPSACEAMGSVNCICVDKTGTLTTSEMVVDKVWICSEEIRGGDDSNALKSFVPESLFYTIIQSLCLNTSAGEIIDQDGMERISGSPTESALLSYGLFLATGLDAKCWKQQLEDAKHFNSVKKKMSVLITLPNGGMRALSKGAPDVILNMCDKIVDGNGRPVSLSSLMREDVKDIVRRFSSEALRTLCFAYQDFSNVLSDNNIPSDGYTLLLVVGIYNPLRLGVKDAVDVCQAAGITIRMVTGDNIDTAKAIAKECGILTDDGIAIEGSAFRSKTPEELKKLIPKIQVLASSLPDDKHKLVASIKSMSGEVVAVTGDGTNDVPALLEADVGLAMGVAGTEVAKENADVVIMDDDFTTITNLIRVGRAVNKGMQNFFQFQLTVNIVAIVLNSLSACITGSPPLKPAQLMWGNMIADILGALALATELASNDVMKRPPFMRTNFINPGMWRNIMAQSIYQLVVLLAFKLKGKWLLKLMDSYTGSTVDTFIFNTFILFQVFNELKRRKAEKLNVLHGICNNWLSTLVILFVVAFQVVLVEYLGFLAGTVPLNWQLWLLSLLIGSSSFLFTLRLRYHKLAKNADKVYECDYAQMPSGPEIA